MNEPHPMRDAQGFIAHLVDEGLLTEATAHRARAALTATGHSLDTVFTELGLMREDAFAKHAAAYLQVDFIEDPLPVVGAEEAAAIGLEFLAAASILPLKSSDAALRLAVADPFDAAGLSMMEYRVDRPIEVCLAIRSTIAAAHTAIGQRREMVSEDLSGGAYEGDIERLRDFAQQAPIVRFVAKVAQTAFDEGATDIHFEPFEFSLRVRIRVDGDLRAIEQVSVDMLPGISTRIKILASLDISERRLPQDGRMRLVVRGQEIDLRVSIVPTIHGETIVLRILDRSTVALDLASLGYDDANRNRLARLSQMPNGIILVTGPTGSGKTTTLYALISMLNNLDTKIFTVEDPVEYRMPGITQLQINTATGLTFARALRSVLRQDPDTILVGEIRDRETAEIAMQAALTGHLVFSTLHTNSAVGSITRLRDMGVENYLIGATVKCVVGQRLLRKSCGCGEHRATCSRCAGTGFKGRTVTHETMEITESIAQHISSGGSEADIERALTDFVPMADHAVSLVQSGMTTWDEVARVVRLANEAAE